MTSAVLTMNPESASAEIIDFNAALIERGIAVSPSNAQLVSANREFVIDLPDELFEMLCFVATKLADGEAVSIAPVSKMMTTQQAADFLGMSRPSLVKIVDAGEIPHAKVGRHRKIRLSDLLDYQERVRIQRADALDEMARIAADEDLYEKTAQSGLGIR